ncbi:MAG TPA: hypothetical protein VM934_16280 [Pyrinomonadaceae bacterium]|jgi:hypothetical protein|nr:hypothetical protein [Pyrinomonadaceae bacterium]
MSAITLDQPITGPIVHGIIPMPMSMPGPDSKLSLNIHALGVHYELEAPIVGSPIIEDSKLIARFIVDDNVYLDLNLIGQNIEQENDFNVGQFTLSYRIEEQRPRAHFVADTLMAVIGLAGRFDLKISKPKVKTNLNIETPLLEISKMLHRRQTAYRLMVIETATGKQFLLPSAISEREIERIAFVYHAIVDGSFIWPGRNFYSSIHVTQEHAASFAQYIRSPVQSLPVEALSETVLGQPINLGRAVVTMDDAVVKNLDEVLEHLEGGDGREVTLEIHSLSGQDKYDFIEVPYSSSVLWEPKIQALINLEPHLDAAITERYHALAAATLSGLSEEEKKEVTTRPELGEAFLINSSDGE